MEEFLRRALTALMDVKRDLSAFDVHLVIGNEAADLDSVISSIVTGYLLHCHKDADSNYLVVPVTNCPREDLPLRTEVVYWLRKHAISPSWLTHREDVTRWWTHVKGEVFHSFSVTLVDHNLPIGDMEFVTPYVVRIIDHHILMPEVQEKIEEVASNGELFWDMVGSTCTLVAHRYFDADKGDFQFKNEDQLLVLALLYGVILLDTLCLSPQHERFKQLDVEMLSKIEDSLELGEGTRSHIYRELEDAKFDVSGLTNNELLRRDAKFIRPHLAICSVAGLDYVTLIHRPHIVNDVLDFCHSEAVGITLILTLGKVSPTDVELRRGIIVSRSSELDCPLSFDLIQYLRSDVNLALESFPSPNQRLVVFAQNNAKLSRKYIMPSVAKFLDNCRNRNAPTSTPLNSPQVTSDSETNVQESNRDLPSLNNLATVQKVHAKRHHLSSEPEKEPRADASPEESDMFNNSGQRSPLPTFTPENSALVTPEEDHRRVHHLPSLNNRETVDRVAEKRRRGWRRKRSIDDGDLELREEDEDEDDDVGGEPDDDERTAMEEEEEEISDDEEGGGVNIHRRRSSANEPFTPTNSLTKEGFMTRLLYRGTDTGRLRGFSAAHISDDEAKRIANMVVQGAMKGGVKRTVRSALETASPTDAISESLSIRSRESIKMKFIDGTAMLEVESRPSRPLLLMPEDPHEDRSRSRKTDKSKDSKDSEDTTYDIGASMKMNAYPLPKGKFRDGEDPGGKHDSDKLDSLASSVFPDYLSSTDTPLSASESPTNEEASLLIDGKRECFCTRVIKAYEGVLQILQDTYTYEDSPCKIVLFFSCLLPRTSEAKYQELMNAIYLYVIKSMQDIAVSDYVLIYVNTGVRNDQTPNFNWLKQCFLTLDQSVRKNIKKLFVVSPTFWTKAIMFFFSVFISKKFFEKIEYIQTIPELTELLPQTRRAYFPQNCFECSETNMANDEQLFDTYSSSSTTLDTNASID